MALLPPHLSLARRSCSCRTASAIRLAARTRSGQRWRAQNAAAARPGVSSGANATSRDSVRIESTATFSSASKGQTWSNYLSGCPKCRYSSCNACRPMHVRAIDGDESAQQRVIKWNERREEKVASASRSLGQKAKASNVRMRRTSSVHAAARTISMSLTPIKQTSTATKSRKSATDKRRKSTQSVQQSRRRNSVEDSAEKRKSITGGGGGGKSSGVQPPRATLRAKRVRELSDLQAD